MVCVRACARVPHWPVRPYVGALLHPAPPSLPLCPVALPLTCATTPLPHPLTHPPTHPPTHAPTPGPPRTPLLLAAPLVSPRVLPWLPCGCWTAPAQGRLPPPSLASTGSWLAPRRWVVHVGMGLAGTGWQAWCVCVGGGGCKRLDRQHYVGPSLPPTHTHPSQARKVINISYGSDGFVSSAEVAAVTNAIIKGNVVVAIAAGNNALDACDSTPAAAPLGKGSSAGECGCRCG